MTAYAVTPEGVVVAVEVEADGAIVGVLGGYQIPGYGPGESDNDFDKLWESIFGVKQMEGRDEKWAGNEYDDWLDSDINSKKPIKGKEFRGGSKKTRDKWYGIKDVNFQKWWEREGKKGWGGMDIQNSEMAWEIYDYWKSIGSPNVNGGRWK